VLCAVNLSPTAVDRVPGEQSVCQCYVLSICRRQRLIVCLESSLFVVLCAVNLSPTAVDRVSGEQSVCQFCVLLICRRQRLIVCLESSLFVHNIHDMKVLHRICDTPLNARGVCALSASSAGTDGFLAYPGSVDVGEVQVFDAVSLVCDVSTLQYTAVKILHLFILFIDH